MNTNYSSIKAFIVLFAILMAISAGATFAQAPVADFTADTTAGCAPLTVNFTDLSTPGGAPIISWLWNFGDGNTDTVQNPANTYSNSGTYTVSLIVLDTLGGSDTVDKPGYITVMAIPPVPPPISGPSNPCVGNTVVYSFLDTLSYTNQWTIPSGWTLLSGQGTDTISVLVGSGGTFICVRSCNSCGCSSFQCKAVSPITIPSPPGPITGPSNPTSGNSAFYSIIDPLTYAEWTVPSGWTILSGQGNSDINVLVGPNSGNICVRLCNICGCTSYQCMFVTVSVCSIPGTPGAITGPTSQCTDNSTTYSISSVAGATSYQWTVPSGWIINSGQGTTSANITADSSSGTVCVNACNGCGCSPFNCKSVSSIPSYSLNTSDITICDGDSALIFGIYSTTAGTYYDSLSTINGCDSVVATTLTVNPTYSTPESAAICSGDSIFLQGAWQNTAGIYYDSLMSINGCDSIIITTLTVNPSPTINLGPDTTICNGCSITLDAGAGFAGYDWSTGANTQTIIVDSASAYTVVVTDSNGCAGSDTIVIDIASGIDQYTSTNNQLEIYPNPNTGQFTLEINLQNNTCLSLILYQIDGRVLLNKDLSDFTTLSGFSQKIDLSRYSKGMYYVQVVTDENVITRKVIYQ